MRHHFSVKPKVWQTIGKSVDGLQSSEQAMEQAGLNYVVEKRPLYTSGSGLVLSADGLQSNDSLLDVPDHFATVRTDTDQALGVVGNGYQIVQNSEAYEFVEAVVGQGKGVEYDTAGVLGKGERIFITAKLPERIRIGQMGKDVVENYLFFTNAHSHTQSLKVGFLPNRLFCANQFNHAMRNMTNEITIRHTASAQERLKQAVEVLRKFQKTGQELEELYNYWAKVRITDVQLRRLIELAMAPSKETLDLIISGKGSEISSRFKNVVDDAFTYAMEAESQLMETTEGTLFGAYNAVTGYFQNVNNYKSPQVKMKSLLLHGDGFNKSQRAFDLCASFTKHGAEALHLN